MDINLQQLKTQQNQRLSAALPAAGSSNRLAPSLWHYDYLVLSRLAHDIHALLRQACSETNSADRVALDLGCDRSPYREILAQLGWTTRTLDIAAAPGVDYVGTIEATGLPDNTFDLILCTQVLEHCSDPWRAMTELHRILRPGGALVCSAPHAWFYHPHPADHWRFTPEGMTRLNENVGLQVQRLLAQGGSVAGFFQVLNFCLFGAAGRLGAPIYLLNNLAGSLLDRAAPNPLFSLNFATLSRKPLRG